MAKTTVTFKDRDYGYKKMVGQLGEMGSVTLGVQGEEARAQHPGSELTVGNLAAIHALGLGVPRRDFINQWMDENQDRMLAETAEALKGVLKGETTRAKVLQKLGYKWTEEMRAFIFAGKVRPRLAEATKRHKGHSIPLVDSGVLANAVTYRVFLPMFKSIMNTAQRAAARNK